MGEGNDQQQLVYAAAYPDVDGALAALEIIEKLHDKDVIGSYDAAVIGKKDGTPHILKRRDHPRYRVIPEVFGHGSLPRKELHEAAEQLAAGEAGLIVIGEPTIEKAMDNAITDTANMVKWAVNASTDEIANELREALKGKTAGR